MKASQKWKIERILYLTLIPISYWFVLFFINSHSDINSLNTLLSNMTNKILLLVFFIISMFHIRIQLGKVYEDYFKLNQMKTYSFLTDVVIGFSFLIFLPVLFF
jgi:succinate dehydrogenase hydrophobic anchor subunit